MQHDPSIEHHSTTITVGVLDDPLVERLGFAVESAYVEYLWLPRLGPSAMWALRRLVRLAEPAPEGVQVDLADLARSLGLGDRLGKTSPMARTLCRLERFEVAVRSVDDRLLVRRALWPLPERQVRALPSGLRDVHYALARDRYVTAA